VITADFDYFAPTSLEEALTVMRRGDVKPLAGGTDLLNNIKTEGLDPKALMYIMNCSDLDYIRKNGGNRLSIGAAARLSDIEVHPEIIDHFPAFRKSVNVIGGTQIRNMATLAGNVCNASPGADTPPVLIVLGAEATINKSGADGSTLTRTVPVEQIFSGVKKTVLEPVELLSEISVPVPPEHSGQSFRRLARVRLDIAKINCAVYIEREGTSIKTLRICFGSVAKTPVRIPTVESMLTGKEFTRDAVDRASESVKHDISPITDVRSTAEYRMQVAPVLLREALGEAWEMAGGRNIKQV
jgi:carbon-monoxide dehydrogenase medium subunit